MRQDQLKIGMLVRLNSHASKMVRTNEHPAKEKAGRHYYGVVVGLKGLFDAYECRVNVFGASGAYKDGKRWLYNAKDLCEVRRG